MQSKLVAWIFIAVAVAAGLLTLLIPTSVTSSISELTFRITLFISVPIAVLHIEAASLFIWGMNGFKRQLRVAYILICAGIALLGIAQLQTPLVSYFDLTVSWYVTSGLVVIPFVAPILLLFAGTKRFAPLLELKTRWASWWYAFGGSVLVSIAALGLAWLTSGNDAEVLASVFLATWASAMLCFAAVMALKITKTISSLYRPALRWFAASNIASAMAGVTYVLSLIILGNENIVSRDGGTLLPDLLAGLLFVRAGYAFKRINEQAVVKAVDAAKTTILDVIQFAAEQASNPVQIDPILDTLRSVTASLPAGQEPVLTAEQEAQLRQTYANIEEYLVTKEPLRQFSAATIRQKISVNFGLNDQQLTHIIGN